MQGVHTFIRNICMFLSAIPKRVYRTCAVITTGVCVVAVIAFSSRQFGGSGKNAGYGAFGTSVTDKRSDTEETEEQDLFKEMATALDEISAEVNSMTEAETAGLSAGIRADVVRNASEDGEYHKESDGVFTDSDIAEGSDESKVPEPQEENIIKDEEDEQEILEVNLSDEVLITTGGTVVAKVMNEAREVTEEEYDILLHIVAAEAGGCDIYGRILVANVIFNRMDDKHFPNNIKDVVFQKNQFSPATKGTLWNAKVTKTTIEAVDRALAGEDYSCGALFFAARKRLGDAKMSNFDTKYEWLFEHDGHEFYRFISK